MKGPRGALPSEPFSVALLCRMLWCHLHADFNPVSVSWAPLTTTDVLFCWLRSLRRFVPVTSRVFLCMCVSVYDSSISLSLSLCLSLSFSVTLSLSLSVCDSLSSLIPLVLSLSLYLSLFFSLCVSLSCCSHPIPPSIGWQGYSRCH